MDLGFTSGLGFIIWHVYKLQIYYICGFCIMDLQYDRLGVPRVYQIECIVNPVDCLHANLLIKRTFWQHCHTSYRNYQLMENSFTWEISRRRNFTILPKDKSSYHNGLSK